jgi:hypothetical protein
MANDFSGDPNCVALWKFDNNALDSKGGNDLTPVNSPAYDSGDKKEGTHCIDLEDSSNQYCTIADAALDAGFPGKNGTSEQSFCICAWIKAESFPTTNTGIITKYVWTGDARSYALIVDTSGNLHFWLGYNGGISVTILTFDTALSTGKWYHIALSYDSSDNGMKIRVWDGDAGALLDSNKEGTAGGDMSPDTAPLEVGRVNESTSWCFDGKIDEVVIFDKVLSDNDIDSIRAGTYSAGVTEKESADSGSGLEAADVEGEGQPENLFAGEPGEGADSLVAKIETPTKGGGLKL